MEKTNPMRALDRAGLSYNVHTYENGESMNGEEVALSLGENPNQVFKTLVTVGKSKKGFVFLIPVNMELDLKKAAASVGEKSVEMMKSKELLDQTGYVHGGCSPLCMKKEMRTVVDSSIQNFDTVYFSAGRIGLQIEMSSKDFLGYTKFKTENISREPANVDRVQST